MSDFIRRMRSLENQHFSEYGQPFKVFVHMDDGTLTDWKTGELVTCDDDVPSAFSVYRDIEGNEIHITHGYAVVVREGLNP